MRIALALFAIATSPLFAGENWTQFRGPAGDGHSDSTGLAVELGEGKNVKWKTAIHGKAWSSPVVWGAQVWLTTANEEGTELGVVCLDKATGKIVHDATVFRVAKPQFCHKFNSYASPTPVIEDGRLYAWFGAPGLACIDTKSFAVLWKREDFECNHYRGAGSSPVVFENSLLLHFDGSDRQYLAAVDKRTGKTVWQVNRSVDYKDLQADGKPEAEGDWRKAFSTPQVIDWQGQPVMLSSGAKCHYGYDPRTGKELWRHEDRGAHSAATRPIAGQGLAFFTTGFGKASITAVRLGGSGVLEEKDIAWRASKAVPNKPSLTLVGDALFAVNDGGIASCLDVKTGEVVWSERIGGNYSAAPLAAEGRLYCANEEGKITVLKTSRTFEKVGEGTFDAGFMASPAVSGSALFLRTKTHLYRVEK